MAIEAESIEVLFPKIVLPYLRQWAESSRSEIFSQLLVDEQFLSLLARYGSQFIPKPGKKADEPFAYKRSRANGNGAHPPKTFDAEPVFQKAADVNEKELDSNQFYERLCALEGLLKEQSAEIDAQQAMLQTVRTRIRPLATALGCCPECVVGLETCPWCFGKSKVGLFEPNPELLKDLVLDPLAVRGTSIALQSKSEARPRRRRSPTTTKKGKEHHDD